MMSTVPYRGVVTPVGRHFNEVIVTVQSSVALAVCRTVRGSRKDTCRARVQRDGRDNPTTLLRDGLA